MERARKKRKIMLKGGTRSKGKTREDNKEENKKNERVRRAKPKRGIGIKCDKE